MVAKQLSILPGHAELSGKASGAVAVVEQEWSEECHGVVERDGKAGFVTVAATAVPELDTARQTAYPSELSAQHLAYEVFGDGLPVPDLATYPYAQSTADARGAQYGPVPHHASTPSVTAVRTPGPPDPAQPVQHSNLAI